MRYLKMSQDIKNPQEKLPEPGGLGRIKTTQADNSIRHRIKYPDYGEKWVCPHCGGTEFECRKTDSEADNGIRRTRVCATCGQSKLYTLEKIVKIVKS